MREVDVARAAALAAGEVLRTRGTARQVSHKSAVDLVTEVDLACEAAIREVLALHTPDVPVLAEEGGGAAAERTRWIVDPLDGTTNFVHGFPNYAVSIALQVDGVLEAGVVLDAVRGDVYEATRGQGAFCGPVRLAVTDEDDLERCLVATGFPYDRTQPGRAAFYLRYVHAVLERAQGLRRAGSAAMDLVFVASGRVDAYWEFGIATWDVAAGALLVREAGGRISAHDGGSLDLARPSPLATNGAIHDAMMQVLASAGSGG